MPKCDHLDYCPHCRERVRVQKGEVETPEQIAQQIAGCPDYHLQGFLNPPICCIYRRQIVLAIKAERERVRALEAENRKLDRERTQWKEAAQSTLRKLQEVGAVLESMRAARRGEG